MLELAGKDDALVLLRFLCLVYDDSEVFPTPESYEGRVDPPGPRSCYGGKRLRRTPV